MRADSAARQTLVRSLYVGHQSWLLGRLHSRLHNRADAEDLTSETFLQVVAHPDLGSVREPRAFLPTLAKRTLFHHWRRRDLEQAYLDSLAQLPEPLVPSAEERVLLLEALERIDRALDGMPLIAKTAFLHSQLDGLRYAEIAGQLGVSLMSVRRYVGQGIARCLAATA